LKHINTRLLYKILKFDKRILKNEKGIVETESSNGSASYYLRYIEKQYKNAKINANEGRYYIESKISKKYITIKNKLISDMI